MKNEDAHEIIRLARVCDPLKTAKAFWFLCRHTPGQTLGCESLVFPVCGSGSWWLSQQNKHALLSRDGLEYLWNICTKRINIEQTRLTTHSKNKAKKNETPEEKRKWIGKGSHHKVSIGWNTACCFTIFHHASPRHFALSWLAQLQLTPWL